MLTWPTLCLWNHLNHHHSLFTLFELGRQVPVTVNEWNLSSLSILRIQVELQRHGHGQLVQLYSCAHRWCHNSFQGSLTLTPNRIKTRGWVWFGRVCASNNHIIFLPVFYYLLMLWCGVVSFSRKFWSKFFCPPHEVLVSQVQVKGWDDLFTFCVESSIVNILICFLSTCGILCTMFLVSFGSSSLFFTLWTTVEVSLIWITHLLRDTTMPWG